MWEYDEKRSFVQVQESMSEEPSILGLLNQVYGQSALAPHARRVADLALGMVKRLDICTGQLRMQTFHAGLLHDLGKLAIPDAILLRPGPLTNAEYAMVQRHPAISASIASTCGVPAEVCLAIRHHHEWWDGSGYPDRLSCEDIPIVARIIGIADAFDAMTSNRPYRRALSQAQAFDELRTGSGTQFDPSLVPILIQVVISKDASGTGLVPTA